MATPAHNTASLLVGTAEFAFSENATSAANASALGWLSLGNIDEMTPEVNLEQLEHKGSYRGIKRTDRTVTTESDVTYRLKADEWNLKNLAILFGASTGTAHTQSSQSAASADAIVFSGGAPSDENLWYDVLVSAARIRGITALTIATLTEGTDFEVDGTLGRVRFLTEQTASRTPVITAAAITSADAGYFVGLTPLATPTRSGFGNLTIFDQDTNNTVVLDHVAFQCDVTADTAGAVNGTAFTEINLIVKMTESVGNILVRNINQAYNGTL